MLKQFPSKQKIDTIFVSINILCQMFQTHFFYWKVNDSTVLFNTNLLFYVFQIDNIKLQTLKCIYHKYVYSTTIKLVNKIQKQ